MKIVVFPDWAGSQQNDLPVEQSAKYVKLKIFLSEIDKH